LAAASSFGENMGFLDALDHLDDEDIANELQM
jgi:hypothetical protein